MKEAAKLTNEHSLFSFLAVSQNHGVIKFGQDLHGHQVQYLKMTSGYPCI